MSAKFHHPGGMAIPKRRGLPAQRSLPDMSSGTRSWLPRIALVVAVFAVVRELSIRRHDGDIHDWPRRTDGDQGT